jgi:hypothetical protein
MTGGAGSRRRKRIRPFLLDRVLRREHEERLGESIRLSGRRHRMLLHRLQQRGLRLRRRAVDLVGEDDVREDRSVHELEDAAPGRVILLEQLRPRDVRRHQVRRELHARERQLERLRDRLHEQCLREPWNADEQRVSAGEQRRDEVVDDVVLAHDPPADLLDEAAPRVGELAEQRDVAGVVSVWSGGWCASCRRCHAAHPWVDPG